jgi:hypothetical protein
VTRPPRRAAALAAAVALALAFAGCITRTVRETVSDQGGLKIVLRGEKRGTSFVEQGYEHPFTIAGVRLAHILSCIDVEDESGKKRERRPAIPTEDLYPIADALAKALAKADSTQLVLVQSLRRTKHLGVFDRYFLTSLLVWAKDGRLTIQVGRSDWEVPKRRRDQLPEPVAGEHPQSFRVLAAEGMTLVDPQSVAVEWRSPVFARPSRTRISPGGEVQRRTILMEAPEEPEPPAAAPSVPELSPEQLRALADLEEARRAGKLSESQYASERDRILAGAAPAPAAGAGDASGGDASGGAAPRDER